MGDDEHDPQDEGEETQPEMNPVWKAALGDSSEDDKAPSGAKVGEIVRLLNDMEPGDFKAAVSVRHPKNGEETLLGWATKKQKFVLVEWLIKQAAKLSDPNNGGEEGLGGRKIAFAFGTGGADAKTVEKEMQCYEKWVEKRKEQEEKEKEKEEERKAAAAEGGEPPEEEEEEPEDPLWMKVKAELEDPEAPDVDAMVQSVGQLGVWQGKRMGGKKGKGAKWGSGQAIFPNGDMYVGEYRENKRHGYGTYVWAAEGNIYIGEWENNHRSGTGRMVYANGGRYFGQWRFDKRNGKGRYTYPNGDTYSGPWVNDVKEGPQGTFTFGRQRDGAEDGSQYIGTFRGGEFVNGEWRLGGGTRYYGVFRNFQPVGKGIFVHRHGHEGSYTQDGTYKDGKWYPSRLRGADEPDPDLDLVVQGRTLRLRFTKEASGQQRGASCPIAALVQVANFTPFEDWVRGLNDPAHPYYKKNFLVRGVEVRSIDWCPETKEVQAVRLKIDALNDDGERWARLGCPDSESITLTQPTCLVIVLLRHGNEERVLWTRKPVLSCGDVRVPALPQVTVVGAAINGNIVNKLRGLGIELDVGTCQSLTKLTEGYGSQVGGVRAVKGMRLHEPETDAIQDVLYYAQDVTKEWWDVLDEKVSKSNMPGDLEYLEAVPLQEAVLTTPDAASLAALYLHQKLREAKRVGNETVEPMRPPTPKPPLPLDRPEIPPPPAPLEKKTEEGGEEAPAEEEQ